MKIRYLSPYIIIAVGLGVSIAKITRGSRELRDKQGGFWQALKMKKNYAK